jgi:hypothetical protein
MLSKCGYFCLRLCRRKQVDCTKGTCNKKKFIMKQYIVHRIMAVVQLNWVFQRELCKWLLIKPIKKVKVKLFLCLTN